MTATFTCARCKEAFPVGRDDSEAREEFDRLFPTDDIQDAVVVCDDCFKALGFCEEGHQ